MNETVDNTFNLQTRLFIMNNITDEVLRSHGLINYWINEGNMQIYIVNMPEIQKDSLSILKNCLNEINLFIQHNYGFTYQVAISNEHTGSLELYKAYNEIQRVFTYQDNTKTDQIFTYHEIDTMPVKMMLKVPVEIENQISSAISIGDSDAANHIVEWIIRENARDCMTLEVIQFLITNIVNIIISTARKYLKSEELNLTNASLLSTINFESEDVVISTLQIIITKICDGIKDEKHQKQSDKISDLITLVKDYVEENYKDSSIGVTSIAEYYNVTQTYLSKIFKDSVGENLSSYINLIRLEHSKSMILEGVKLDYVSQECGFGSLRTFLRIFKQYTGITPSQFKNLQEGKDMDEKVI